MFDKKKLISGLFGALFAAQASAIPVLYDNTLTTSFQITNNTTFMADFNATNSLSVISGGVANSAILNTFDGVWVDGIFGNAGEMTGTEEANLKSFIAAGNKAVFIADNAGWSGRYNSIERILDASINRHCGGSVGTSSSSHALTLGISTFGGNTCNSTINQTANVDLLFTNAQAGLFSIGLGEAVLVTSVDFLNSDRSFYKNVFTWLNDPIAVPGPSTLVLFSLGIIGLGFSRKRKAV